MTGNSVLGNKTEASVQAAYHSRTSVTPVLSVVNRIHYALAPNEQSVTSFYDTVYTSLLVAEASAPCHSW